MAGPIAASPRRAGDRPETTVKEIGVERPSTIGRMANVGAPRDPTPEDVAVHHHFGRPLAGAGFDPAGQLRADIAPGQSARGRASHPCPT